MTYADYKVMSSVTNNCYEEVKVFDYFAKADAEALAKELHQHGHGRHFVRRLKVPIPRFFERPRQEQPLQVVEAPAPKPQETANKIALGAVIAAIAGLSAEIAHLRAEVAQLQELAEDNALILNDWLQPELPADEHQAHDNGQGGYVTPLTNTPDNFVDHEAR